MDPETEFYQVSGYRAHSNGWFKMYDDKPMISAIASNTSKLFRTGGQDSPVELVLGILPAGASYLLMSSAQMLEFTHKHRLKIPRDPWRAGDFISLSPIYFSSRDELATKIATYKQRPRNKNRREHEEPLDNSQANRGYVKTGTDVVHYRGYFEHQRTLYRLLTRKLEPGKVGLAPQPWLKCVRIVSLVVGEWIADERIRSDRLKEPMLVDAGWTDTLLPSFFQQSTGTTVHLDLDSGKRNPASKEPYFSKVFGEDEAGMNARLRTLFTHDANKSGIPLIVLVHDEDMARSVLSRAGIDVDSWPSGFSKLMPLVPTKTRIKVEEGVSQPAVLPAPSIIDVQKLVRAVMETNPGITVPYSAKALHMQTDIKTCAGDDSLLQLHMWTSMAQGLAIDEQHKERSAQHPDRAHVLAYPEQTQTEDEPVDTNDVPCPGPRPTIANDFSDDDDW